MFAVQPREIPAFGLDSWIKVLVGFAKNQVGTYERDKIGFRGCLRRAGSLWECDGGPNLRASFDARGLVARDVLRVICKAQFL